MILMVNGEAMVLDDGITVRGLVEQLGWHEGPVAVERNGDVVPRAEHTNTTLLDGDQLEIVHFVGGG